MSPTTLRLRELRTASGLSQVELGRRAHVRQATISRLERGPVRLLDLGVLDRLASALHVQPVLLLGWENGAPPNAPRKAQRARRR